MSTQERTQVFISYSHDSREHMDRVLTLSNRLRADGVDCNIDQYEELPSEGWPRWMVNQIKDADFVLVVCTEEYERRFRGKEESGKGLGAQWEGAIITQEIYEAVARKPIFIPVLFSPDHSAYIPIVLRGATHYNLDSEEGYEALYRRLTNQPLLQKSERGSKEGLAGDASQKNAINDKPIDDIKNDQLGFTDYVHALREFITSQDTTTPLTIGINGAWGSGKSSLMRMLQRELEPMLPHGLRWLEVKWIGGWLSGTFLWILGQLATWRYGGAKREHIRLGLAFGAGVDADEKEFDRLLERYVHEAVLVEDQRLKLVTKSRFWARQAARRRKMTPLNHPAVWFNAWKFSQQEQIWSALALAVLDQLRCKYGLFMRLLFLCQLTYRRTDKRKALAHAARKMVVPLMLAAVVAVYEIIKERFLSSYMPSALILPDRWAWLAPIGAALWQAWKAIEDPFNLPITDVMDKPNYREKIGFLGAFEEDFGRIVNIVIRRSVCWQPRKLVIFIDDLDRCSPAQAASIIEAINLFLDCVGCVFILGMDFSTVAASIEVKYKELTEKMRRDAPDIISPGMLFLDKIVQIPFNMPRPRKDYISGLVAAMIEPKSPRVTVPSSLFKNARPPRSSSRSPTPPIQEPKVTKVDRASFAQEDVRQAILFASRLLKENPRQVKRFVNQFRLQIYIADQRGMLSDNPEFGLSPKMLAIWVAWCMQWPEIFKILADPAWNEDLCSNLANICHALEAVEDKNAEEQITWTVDRHGSAQYLEVLNKIREEERDSTSHWSKLPWHLWIKESDFLHCLKELERYWKRTSPLDSLLDMTKVTAPQHSGSVPPFISSQGGLP
jgi:hypothetical protein